MPSKETVKEYDLIVIGGGASGMMAAGVAARNGHRVLLIEKNAELGKKLKITGGGRCNITNATFDTRQFLAKFGKNEQFLYSPFSQFGVAETFKFFESQKLPLVTEARNRVFPKSQKAADVLQVMSKFINHPNIDVITENPVFKLRADKLAKTILSVDSKKGSYTARNFLIASGGASHPETGSTGDGFRWLRDLGHTVKNPSPSIVPLKVSDRWVRELAGTSLSFMKITFYVDGKKAFAKTGKILFTHFGLSGPLILNSAHQVADLLHAGEVTATIDCYPDTDLGSLEKHILKIFDQNKNKLFKNVASEIAPKGLAGTLVGFDLIANTETKVHSVSKEERKQIVRTLKAMPLKIAGLMDMSRAVISDGGVPLTEIETKTMKSKLYNNLYLTGDILDINRPSGGLFFAVVLDDRLCGRAVGVTKIIPIKKTHLRVCFFDW